MGKSREKVTNKVSKKPQGVLSAKLKKKIRDVERLLKRDSLNGTTRTENERKLKALKVQLANSSLNLQAKKNAKKYHMVRFFEKKKAVRKLKQAIKTLEEAKKTEVKKDIKKARKSVKFCEIDLVYTIMFPKNEKYISLYPNPKDEDKQLTSTPQAKAGKLASESLRREKRKEYEKLIEEDKLPFTLEDVLAGKTISLDSEVLTAKMEQEIDAEGEENGEEEDDEFLEEA